MSSTEDSNPTDSGRGTPEPETPTTAAGSSPVPSAEPESAPLEDGGKARRRKRKAKKCAPLVTPRGEKPPRQSTWCAIREVLVILLIAALVAVLIQSFVLKAFVIPSGSMEPTLKVGDRVFAEKLTYYFRKPKRGDIIVFRYPPNTPQAMNTTNLFYWPFQQILETFHIGFSGTTPFVKRVVATEGETLEVRKGKLYINGKRIKEDYAVPDDSNFGPVKVPEGMVYGFGDNRPNSNDGRFWGPIPVRSIIGRTFLVWWPFSHFGRPKGKPTG